MDAKSPFDDEIIEIEREKLPNVGPRGRKAIPRKVLYPDWTIDRIRELANEYRERTGEFPNTLSGKVAGSTTDSWCAINVSLRKGNRGLPGGSSLAALLSGNQRRLTKAPLSVEMILHWADLHHDRTGRWPNYYSGDVTDSQGVTWIGVHLAVKNGLRGLSGGTTLARLLAEHRGAPLIGAGRDITAEMILKWADEYQAMHGKWPSSLSGAVPGSVSVTWLKIDKALMKGNTTLPKGSSLAVFLGEHRNRRNIFATKSLDAEQLMSWAHAHKRDHGEWPHALSGDIPGTGETWKIVDNALKSSIRGLANCGYHSLSHLLRLNIGQNRKPPKRNHLRKIYVKPFWTVALLIELADLHHARTGTWPRNTSGMVADSPGDTWRGIDACLKYGYRGLTGGTSLYQILRDYARIVPRPPARAPAPARQPRKPELTIDTILSYADRFFAENNAWPSATSGIVPDSGGDTWSAINGALLDGHRGLSGGLSLSKVLAAHRGVSRSSRKQRLVVETILVWADAYYSEHGCWPTQHSGAIPESYPDSWKGVDGALRSGLRGLPGSSSLTKLLAERRGKRSHFDALRLTEEKILAWADVHYADTGRWPNQTSGRVTAWPGETWSAINAALSCGTRGLPGGTTLRVLLLRRRGAIHRGLRPPLDEELILMWADTHHARYGGWPHTHSGAVPGQIHETWANVDNALNIGLRSLPRGSSLAKLLAARRGVRNPKDLQEFSVDDLCRWSLKHFRDHGRWPTLRDGAIPESPGDTWGSVYTAITWGSRGMGGLGYTSLADFLNKEVRGSGKGAHIAKTT